MGIAETQHLLDQLEQVAPALVRQTVPKPVSLSLLADVLRRMVEEQVSIRDLRAILEALSTRGRHRERPAEPHRVRARAAPARDDLPAHRRAPRALGLPARCGDRGSDPARHHPHPGGELSHARPGGTDDDVVAADAPGAVAQVPTRSCHAASSSPSPTSVASFAKLIEVDFPEVDVVSFAELLPEISLRPLAKATLAISS